MTDDTQPTETQVAGGELALVVLRALTDRQTVEQAHASVSAAVSDIADRMNVARCAKAYAVALSETGSCLAMIAHGVDPFTREDIPVTTTTLPLLLQRATTKATMELLTAALDGTPPAQQDAPVTGLLATSDSRFHIEIAATITRDMVALVAHIASRYAIADDIVDHVRARGLELDLSVTDAELEEWAHSLNNPNTEGDAP